MYAADSYVDRTEDVTEIKVYSNEQKRHAFCGRCGAERPSRGALKYLNSEVPITGTHKIRAVSGACDR